MISIGKMRKNRLEARQINNVIFFIGEKKMNESSNQKSVKKAKGSRTQRTFITVLSIVFAILFFWVLSFLTEDIGSMQGPDFDVVKEKYVAADLEEKRDGLNDELAKIKRNIHNKREQRGILKDSTNNLQNTIRQLLEIQKQSLEKEVVFPKESSDTLAKSQTHFLANQREYQQLNVVIGELTSKQQVQKRELDSIAKQLKEQLDEAHKENRELWKVHRMKVAVLKLAVLLPIFLVAAWFFAKKRCGTYAPMVYAAFITVFLKVSLVAHEHFPSRYFKYVAILVVLGIVIKILVHLLGRIASPKKDWLVKQYQEAYDKFVCPICAKPIRVGPLRYAANFKAKVSNAVGLDSESLRQHSYTCPSCGTGLYEKCEKCQGICHSLLPFCEHCGNEK